MKEFLQCNELRTKLTAETFQPIRVVKFSGLEDVFISRTEKARAVQVVYSARAQLAQWLTGAVMRALPPLVDFVVIVVYINVHHSTPKDFVVSIISHIPYLVQLILSAGTLPSAYLLSSSSFSSPPPPSLWSGELVVFFTRTFFVTLCTVLPPSLTQLP